MNTKLVSLALPLCLLCLAPTVGSAEEPTPSRPAGIPENELIARDDYQKAIDGQDLADALGILHFNFKVQVPDGTSFLNVKLQLIEDGKDQEVGRVKLWAAKRDDAGNLIKGAKLFRVVVMLMPLDNSSTNPLAEARKLRVFAKESLTGNSGGSVIIDNPLRKQPGGVSIYNTAQVVRPPGVLTDFGTRFDVLCSDDHKRVLRVSFEKAAELETTK